MNDIELRELDAWIAENVMGWKRIHTDPAAAFAVLEKCAEKCGQIKLTHPKFTVSGLWHVSDMDSDNTAKHANQYTAICLFARKVWG